MNTIQKIHFMLLVLSVFKGTAQNNIRATAAMPAATNMVVNTYTGNLFYSKDLMGIKGRGLDLELSIYYNSTNADLPKGLGFRWKHSFDIRYSFEQGGTQVCNGEERVLINLVFKMPNGTEKRFRANPNTPCQQQDSLLTYPTTGLFDSVSVTPTEFILITKYGIKYHFNRLSENRFVRRIVDRNGNTLTFTYDGNHQLTQVTDASNRFFTFHWNGNQLTTVEDPTTSPQRVVKFEHQVSNNGVKLTKVMDPLGKSIKFTYASGTGTIIGDLSMMQAMTDENDHTTSIGIWATGVTFRVATCLTRHDFSFLPNGNRNTTLVKETTESEPQITTYEYVDGKNTSKNGNCCGYKTSLTYDAANNISSHTDGNEHTTRYTYDNHGNVTGVTDANNCSEQYSYEPRFNQVVTNTDKNGQIRRYHYDGRGNLTRIEYPLNISEQLEYDDFGQLIRHTDKRGAVTTYQYNVHGYLTQMTHPVNSHTTQFSYDARGNQTAITNENGHTTHYEYDLMDRLVKKTDALGRGTTFRYDNKGNRIEVTNAKGSKTQFSYDALDRLTVLTLPLGNRYKFTYDTRGNIVKMEDTRGTVTRYEYNTKNLVERVLDGLGYATHYEYDGIGNQTMRIDAMGNRMQYRYDAEDRLIEQIDALGNPTRWSYDCNSNLLSVTDANQHTMQQRYDGLNRVTTWTDALNAVSLFEYDANNNLTKLTDAKQQATVYEYDAMNRNTSVRYADNSIKAYTYDGVGNVKTRLDGNNQTTRYEYDALNRLTRRDYADANDDFFDYDELGKLTYAKNLNAEIRWTYDSLNQLLSETLNGKSTQYTYDVRNGKRYLVYPSGKSIEESYNVMGQLINLKESGAFVASFGYDSLHRMIQRRYANNTATAYQYDANHRLTRLTHHPNAFIDLKYAYDKVGNTLTQTFMHKLERSEKYVYDANDRLISYQKGTLSNGNITNPIQNTTYQYDALGNRTTVVENGVTASYVTNVMNGYTSISGGQNRTLSYDGNGNMLSDGTMTLSYDFENQLKSVTQNNQTIDYQYDALNRKIAKTAMGQVDHYYFNDQNFIEATDNQGQTVTSKIYTNSLDDAIATTTMAGRSFIQSGKFNSVLALTNEANAVTQLVDYEPFGKPTFYNSTTGNANNQELFTGRYMDTMSNLVDLRSRQLNTKLGRFLQRDKIGYGDGLNMYAYVKNNPIKYFDPYGTEVTIQNLDNFKPKFSEEQIGAGIGMILGTLPTATALLVFLAPGYSKYFSGNDEDYILSKDEAMEVKQIIENNQNRIEDNCGFRFSIRKEPYFYLKYNKIRITMDRNHKLTSIRDLYDFDYSKNGGFLRELLTAWAGVAGELYGIGSPYDVLYNY